MNEQDKVAYLQAGNNYWPKGAAKDLGEYMFEAGMAHRDKQAAPAEPVTHSVVSGALFDFMGWLTSRDKQLVLSSTDDASPAVVAIQDFAKIRELSLDAAKVAEWTEYLAAQPVEPVASVVRCYTPSGKRVALFSKYQHLPIDTDLYAHPPADLVNEQMRERLREAIIGSLGEAYDCTRVWEAWHCGTMGPGDFVQIAEDDARVEEIVNAVMNAVASGGSHEEQ